MGDSAERDFIKACDRGGYCAYELREMGNCWRRWLRVVS
jgi:hypothetical protein